jgi:hypothetical protein
MTTVHGRLLRLEPPQKLSADEARERRKEASRRHRERERAKRIEQQVRIKSRLMMLKSTFINIRIPTRTRT